MNWSKAKKILIIALVFTNLILFTFNLKAKSFTDGIDKRSFLKQVEQLLEKDDIKLSCEIPRGKRSLSSLRVEFESIDSKILNERFFEKEAILSSPSRDTIKLQKKDELLTVINKRRLLYENLAEGEKGENIKADEAEKLALEFLKKRKYPTDDLRLVQNEIEGRGRRLVFAKIYKNTILEKSFTSFYIEKTGIKTMDRLWLNVLEEGDLRIYLPPASKTILGLLSKKDLQHKTIEKIETCYYFDPEAQGFVEDITKALQGKATPAWRVEFSDGEAIILAGN
ncbi:two-component system regulatory protein YycI [Peptoniphilus sp. GNH]|nr:YycH protein [Clostridiales bacterium KA00134]UHR02308.1 two-component system regulatory protein YycI [Peptoniphilus sp. GNH]